MKEITVEESVARNIIRCAIEANSRDMSVSWMRTIMKEQHGISFRGNLGEWIHFVEQQARAVGARIEKRGRARYVAAL